MADHDSLEIREYPFDLARIAWWTRQLIAGIEMTCIPGERVGFARGPLQADATELRVCLNYDNTIQPDLPYHINALRHPTHRLHEAFLPLLRIWTAYHQHIIPWLNGQDREWPEWNRQVQVIDAMKLAADELDRIATEPDYFTTWSGSQPDAGNETPTVNVEARAIGVLAVHPEWTNKEIAEKIGTNAKYLSSLPRFRAARAAIKATGKSALPEGSKSKDGELEAWQSG